MDSSDRDFVKEYGDKRPYQRDRDFRKEYSPVLNASRRRLIASQLALAGMETEEIVESLRAEGFFGVTPEQVAKDLRLVKKEWRAGAELALEQKIEREARKLDVLEQLALEMMQHEGRASVRDVLSVMKRRANLLGLDAPRRVAVGGDPRSGPIRQRVAFLSDEELERIARQSDVSDEELESRASGKGEA